MLFNNFRWVSCNNTIGGHIVQNNSVASNDCIISYMDITENTSSCTDHHIISNDWSFSSTYAVRPFRAERNMLEYRAL